MFGMPNTAPLSKAVERLARPHWHTDGPRAGMEEALLVTLERAVASTGGKGSAAGVSRTGSPVDLGALDLLDEIISVLREHVPNADLPRVRALPVARRLILWTEATAGQEDAELELLDYCYGWERAIRRHLEPPKEIPLKGVACLECKKDSVVVLDPDGGRVNRPILTAYASQTPVRVTCAVCETEWEGDSIEALAISGTIG